MDAYKDGRPTQGRWIPAHAGKGLYDVGVVAYTRYKLSDMRLSVLYAMDQIDAGAIEIAQYRATMNCGAYLAHARMDLTFDEIKRILALAGGDHAAIDNMDEHLHNWRFRGGYTEEEYQKTQKLRGIAKALHEQKLKGAP